MAPLTSRWWSARADRRRNRIDQFRVAEWLEQALHRTVVEKAWADSLLRVRGNENDRDFLAPTRELSLEIGSRHSWHGDVKNQALRLPDDFGRQERFRGRECLDGKTPMYSSSPF
jgi:hypothetical protein